MQKPTKKQILARVSERLKKEMAQGDPEVALARIHALLASRHYSKEENKK
jgi:hypothetical protein